MSAARTRRARDTAWEFEQAREAFAKLWPWAKLRQGRPVLVLVAKDANTLKRGTPKYWEIKGGIRPASVGARGTNREFSPTSGCSHQQQVRHVHACDYEQKEDASLKDEHRCARIAGELVAHGQCVTAESGRL